MTFTSYLLYLTDVTKRHIRFVAKTVLLNVEIPYNKIQYTNLRPN